LAEEKLQVVASFSIIADLVKAVAGEKIALHTLVGAEGDVHGYEATPQDTKTLAHANLVFINGLGLESWMERLIHASDYQGKIISLSQNIIPLKTNEKIDPHAWQNVGNAKLYVQAIANALSASDPGNSLFYQHNATLYVEKLDALDAWIINQIATIPAPKRKLITTHDAFGYFAARYGVQFLSIIGTNADAQPSATQMAHIIDTAKKDNITAIFLENKSDPRLMKQLEKDAGLHIGGVLYSDSLSPETGDASTYILMMQHNVNELVKALR